MAQEAVTENKVELLSTMTENEYTPSLSARRRVYANNSRLTERGRKMAVFVFGTDSNARPFYDYRRPMAASALCVNCARFWGQTAYQKSPEIGQIEKNPRLSKEIIGIFAE
ncbi:MAG: hypothetical protein U5N85_21900 [Arcicella sp.]|nr:hypothetical protein [Arcicella sp.]